MKFKESYIKTFTGGDFELNSNPETVKELRQWLKDIDAELAKWGDDEKLFSVEMDKNKLVVVMKEGLLQG